MSTRDVPGRWGGPHGFLADFILDALRELLPLAGPPGAAGAVAPADVGRRDSILSRLRDAEDAAQVAQLDNFYTRALAAKSPGRKAAKRACARPPRPQARLPFPPL